MNLTFLIILLSFLFLLLIVLILLLYRIGYFHVIFSNKIDKNSEKHGGEIVADVLKAHGVKFLFTLTGGHISPILVASEKKGIKVVDTRHEASAVFAADAVARLSRSIGVAAVTAGPGITNSITAIKNAQMAESPILLIGGAAATLLKGRGALQDIDQMSLLKPLCKYTASIARIRDIKDTLYTAIQLAQSGTPGPVFVEFPIDTLYPYKLIAKEIGISSSTPPPSTTPPPSSSSTTPPPSSPSSPTPPSSPPPSSQSSSPPPLSHSSSPESPPSSPSTTTPPPPPSSPGGGGLYKKLINFYLQTHLDYLFAGAFDEASSPLPPPLPVPNCLPSKNQVQQCVELISKTTRPVLLLGSQSMTPPTPVEQFKTAVEELGVPTFLGGMSRGLLGRNSEIQFRHCRKEALKEADCVILAGTVCDFRLGYGKVLSRKSKIISINRDDKQLMKNSDMFWAPVVAMQCDVATAFVQIVDGLKGYKCDAGWIKRLRRLDDQKEDRNIEVSNVETSEHLNPVKILRQLENVLREKTILVLDGGDFVGTAAYVLRPRGPLTWLDPGAFGTLGVGGGFALGAKLCRPDHDVWIIYGDGSLGFSVAEFDTFTRHETPVIALVGNDACWSQIARDQVRIFGQPTACNLAFCKYELVANGYGGEGVVINRANEKRVEEVLKDAMKKSKAGKSVLLNCFIGSTNFRDGSLSV